jgi:hypothetical protein
MSASTSERLGVPAEPPSRVHLMPASVKWGVSPCPFYGDENPTGANPGDVVLAKLGLNFLVGLLRGYFRHIPH